MSSVVPTTSPRVPSCHDPSPTRILSGVTKWRGTCGSSVPTIPLKSFPQEDADPDSTPIAMSSTTNSFGIFKSEALRTSEGGEKQLEFARLSINDWNHLNDREFAVACMSQIARAERLQASDGLLHSCRTCRNLRYDFALDVVPSELAETEESCPLCKVLLRQIRKDETYNDVVRIIRIGANLRVNSDSWLMAVPIIGKWSWHEDLVEQNAFSILLKEGTERRLTLLRCWLRDCDKHHKCYPQLEGKEGNLPTRVLDLLERDDSKRITLHCPRNSEKGAYAILSHRWGSHQEQSSYCTYQCTLEEKCRGIEIERLPKNFQDAITVTRGLGLRFLWIDSMCIIQPHAGCDEQCRTPSDWNIECEKMEQYFSGAYCTIASTSPESNEGGFLNRQRKGQWKVVKYASELPPSDHLRRPFDSFYEDVEEAGLNKRGWVLQERALSRRMLHFTDTQVYWECGGGVRCETFTRMTNHRTDFLSDPEFPILFRQFRELNRLELAQLLFSQYSNFGLTYSTDRPIAIRGLEQRLPLVLGGKVVHGIFDRYLLRSLFWCRNRSVPMQRIQFPDQRTVPSWSWLAWDASIHWRSLPDEGIEWNQSVRLKVLQAEGKTQTVAVSGPITRVKMTKEDGMFNWTVFDNMLADDFSRLYCLVLAIRTDGRYDVLLLNPTSPSSDCRLYERTGIASLQVHHLEGQTPLIMGKVI